MLAEGKGTKAQKLTPGTWNEVSRGERFYRLQKARELLDAQVNWTGREGHTQAEGILKGLYRFKPTSKPKAKQRAQLLGSGAILPEVVKAQAILEEKYDVGADVWSVTSYGQLYRDGHAAERWNMLHPAEAPKIPYVTQALADAPGVSVGLSEGPAGCDRPLAAAPSRLAGH